MWPGIAAQHDDAIGQQHGFLDVVGHDEDAPRGHGLLGPQLEQFAAQVLGGEHVERGEGLVHEQHFRLDDQGARKADALLHAAGEFLGIRGFESVEADRIEHLHAAVAALVRIDAAGLQRGLHVLKHREPRKQRKALEDDGDVDLGLGDRLFVPVNLAGGGPREPGKHAQHGGLAGAGGPEQGDNLAGNDAQVGGRNDLDAVLAGLRVVLLDLFGANDRFAGANSGFAIGRSRSGAGVCAAFGMPAGCMRASPRWDPPKVTAGTGVSKAYEGCVAAAMNRRGEGK